MVEHSDITPQGGYFVKFFTKGRIDFFNHIKGRYVYGYHRIDHRTSETHEQKERRATATKTFFETEKQRKKDESREAKRKRIAAYKRMQRVKAVKSFIHSRARAAARMFGLL